MSSETDGPEKQRSQQIDRLLKEVSVGGFAPDEHGWMGRVLHEGVEELKACHGIDQLQIRQ